VKFGPDEIWRRKVCACLTTTKISPVSASGPKCRQHTKKLRRNPIKKGKEIGGGGDTYYGAKLGR
jgi:hypothetical protein